MATESAQETPTARGSREITQIWGLPVAIWVALIPVISTPLAGLVGYLSGQLSEHGPHVNQDGIEINKVKAEIIEPLKRDVGDVFICSGTISNFKPETQHLWLAVEVNGYLWFKNSRIEIDANRGIWSATVQESGPAKEMSLLLFVATDAANERIVRWHVNGARQNNYERISSAGEGVHQLDHRDFLQFRGKP